MIHALITLTGPSGVGKSTIRRELMHRAPDRFSIIPMVTVRGPKAGDDGEYVYVTKEEFDALQKQGAFAGHTRVPGKEDRHYAYRLDDIRTVIDRGLIPLLVTDRSLVLQLKDIFPLYSIGLLPPGNTLDAMLAILHQRLQERGRDSEEEIADRLQNAKEDISLLQAEKSLFDEVIVNADLSQTVGHLLL